MFTKQSMSSGQLDRKNKKWLNWRNTKNDLYLLFFSCPILFSRLLKHSPLIKYYGVWSRCMWCLFSLSGLWESQESALTLRGMVWSQPWETLAERLSVWWNHWPLFPSFPFRPACTVILALLLGLSPTASTSSGASFI